MDEAGVPALVDAIRHMHGCEATWIESVHVHETFNGRTVWQGDVELFDLTGHPKASRAYAWSYVTKGDRRQFVAVLHVPPVDSPLLAVRASIKADMLSPAKR